MALAFLSSNANSLLFNYPQTLVDRFGFDRRENPGEHLHDMRFPLIPDSEDDDSTGFFRRVSADIREICIQTDKNAILFLAQPHKASIINALELLAGYRFSIVSLVKQGLCDFDGQIFINLESHLSSRSCRKNPFVGKFSGVRYRRLNVLKLQRRIVLQNFLFVHSFGDVFLRETDGPSRLLVLS